MLRFIALVFSCAIGLLFLGGAEAQENFSAGGFEAARLTSGIGCGQNMRVDVEIGDRKTPVDEIDFEPIFDHYSRHALEYCSSPPRTIQFALRSGDFLVNSITALVRVDRKRADGSRGTGEYYYRYNGSRVEGVFEREAKTDASADLARQMALRRIEYYRASGMHERADAAEKKLAEMEAARFEPDPVAPDAFRYLDPPNGACKTKFDSIKVCGSESTPGRDRIARLSSLSGKKYAVFPITASLNPPSRGTHQFYVDRHNKELEEQFAQPSAFVSFEGPRVNIDTGTGRESVSIKTMPAGSDILINPGNECFEAPLIGPGCYFILHADGARLAENLFLAKRLEANSRGKQTWRAGVVAYAREIDSSNLATGRSQMASAQAEIEKANADSQLAGRPKPFLSFAFAEDSWEDFYTDIYEGERGGGSAGALQTNQMVFHAYHSAFSSACSQHIPAASPVYEFKSERVVDTDTEYGMDGTTTTYYWQEYISRRVPVRSQYFGAYKAISDNFSETATRLWMDEVGYRSPLGDLAVLDTSLTDAFLPYIRRLRDRSKMFEDDALSLILQEGCISPTIRQYESRLDALPK